MQKRLISKLLRTFLLTLCLLGMLGVQTFAEEASPNVEFSVKSKTPENQIDPRITYFYIKSEPNMKQTLEVDVTNLTNNPIAVEGSVNLALSNDNGYITYDGSITGREHESMVYKITDYVTVSDPVINLEGNETKTFYVDVAMPEAEFSGILLGGIHFTKVDKEEKPSSGIGHTYSYNVGLVIAGDDQTELQKSKSLELINVVSEVSNGDKVNVLTLANPEPAIFRNLSLNIEIVNLESLKTVINETVSDLEIAPNSTMDYHVNWQKKDVVAGKYVAKINATSGDDNWNWEHEFEITADKANEMNDEATNKMIIPTWFNAVAIPVGIITIINAGYLTKRIINRNKEKKEV